MVDLVLVMSVNPVWRPVLYRIHACQGRTPRRAARHWHFLIEMDGGINRDTIARARQAGVDVFVAGSAIFLIEDRGAAIVQFSRRSAAARPIEGERLNHGGRKKVGAKKLVAKKLTTKKSGTLSLGLKALTPEDVWSVAVERRRVALAPVAVKRIERAHAYLASRIAAGETLYGVNTGFGLLSNVCIPEEDIEQLQTNLLRLHACGLGNYLEDRYVRAMMSSLYFCDQQIRN